MNERRPVTHRTLCAIARAVLDADRAIDDGEWKERVKRRLVAQGWAYPDRPHMLGAALSAVERIVRRPHANGSRP